MKALLPYLLLAAVFLAVSGLVAVLGLGWGRRFGARGRALSGRLQHIRSQRRGLHADALVKPGSPLLQRLPGAQALAALLVRAGSPRTPAQVMLLGLAGAAACWLLLAVVLGVPGGPAVVLACPAAGWPVLRLVHLAHRRRLRFEEQLPEALDLMTRALRAGYGLSVALGMAGDELQDPLAGEFRHAFDQLNVGLGFAEAMGEMSERVRSQDLNFLVIALTIQRKTGGNLTELLTSLARTMRERVKLKGKVRVLSSEGRLSGLMIGALPFVLACLLTLINPTYMATLWNTEAGRTVVLVGLGMLAAGALWMWKIVQIKV